MSLAELHSERLGTTNADGSRAYVYPADVQGPWRRRRTVVHFVLIAILLIAPWLKVHGEQLFLFDLANRHFIFFGKLFGMHDAPILFLIVAGFVFALVTATALWGRVWCGWACPQTVFIDGLFRRLERWIEGSHLERRKRDLGKITFDKIWRRVAKWSAFSLTAFVIAHSVLAYFVGADKLLSMIGRSPGENATYFVLVTTVMAGLLFDLGWFREQFCVIVCPYGRFQSVLMDANTTTILYDVVRGEPRKGIEPATLPRGDCVSCSRCVRVCPTGIDIRRGIQLECINCTACVDACDDIMVKVGKPKGLIRFSSQRAMDGKVAGRRLQARIVLYVVLMLATWGTFTYIFFTRGNLDAVILRAGGDPFSQLKVDGQEFVVNHFRVELSSRVRSRLSVTFELPEPLKAAGVSLVTPFNPLELAGGEISRAEIFVRFPKALLENGSARVEFEIKSNQSEPHREELRLVGPFT